MKPRMPTLRHTARPCGSASSAGWNILLGKLERRGRQEHGQMEKRSGMAAGRWRQKPRPMGKAARRLWKDARALGVFTSS